MQLKNLLHSRTVAVVAGATVIAGLGAGAGVAAGKITSAQIADGTIRSVDIRDSTVQARDLTVGARDSLKGQQGPRGLQGPAGADGAPGPAGLAGGFYAVAYYDVGDTNQGAIATVACDPDQTVSQTYTAISGGVQTLGLTGGQPSPIASSFPGRMDFTTNTPKPDRLDGWIVQFAGDVGQAPMKTKIWALCVPTTDIAVKQTYTQSE